MSETTASPSADAAPADATMSETEAALEQVTLSIRSLLEAGAHFGHQTQRWNPLMRSYIFGERNGTHIMDLDQTLPLFAEALDYIRQAVSEGGNVMFVGTKRQAAPSIKAEALRCNQFYANNRWLGGMLTNFKTVKKSIDRYKQILETLGDEEKRSELSKKDQSKLNRQAEKYQKSLEGIREMNRLPSVLFVIDVKKEEIAVSEGRRLGIPIVGIVDSNCSPKHVDFVVPGNDDALRAIDLYCKLVADAVLEGSRIYNDRLQDQAPAESEPAQATATGRRVVEIKQAPRRGRGSSGGTSGRTQSAGGRDRDDAPAADASAAAAAPAAEATAAAEASVAEAAPVAEPAAEAVPAAEPAAETTEKQEG